MRKGIVPLDWKLIGSILANESENEQIDFFKAFIEEMRHWESTNFEIHRQLIFIANGLPEADRQLWSFLCDQHGE